MKRLAIFILIFTALLGSTFLVIEFQKGEDGALSTIFSQEPVPEHNNPETTKDELKFINQGPAPEFTGITKWLNTEKPILMAEQQSKVVLINFWTYSCIHCINSLPYLIKWDQKYKEQGLTIVGVHTPEFAFEKVSSNIEAAIKRYGITYPIALDNNYKTWAEYKNQFWPAIYLIDKNGEIVYSYFGEGKYEKTELAIRTLLGLEGDFEIPESIAKAKAGTPDIYLGLARLANFGGTETPSAEQQIYAFPKKLAKNKFALEGRWSFEQEAVMHSQGFGRLRLNFNASKIYMVAQSPEAVTTKIYVDGKLEKGLTIKESDLYPLYESSNSGQHTLEIEFPQSGVQIFSLTFE